MENYDEMIDKARINLARKFSKEFDEKKDTKELAKLLYDREKILRGDINTAKKYI